MGEAQPPPVRFVLPDDDPRPGEPADLLTRGAAQLVEFAIWSCLQFIGFVVAMALAALLALIGVEWIGGLLALVLLWLLPWGLHVWLEAVPRGQVYGKHLMRAAVVDARTGQPGIGIPRSLARQLAKVVSAIPLGLGFLWMVIDPQRRTWHDLLTGTRVVRVAQDKILDPATFLRRTGVASVTVEPPAPAA